MMNLFLLQFTKEEFRVLIPRLRVSRRLQEGMGSDHLRPRWVDTKHLLDLQPMFPVVRENVDVQPLGRVLHLQAAAER